MGDNIKTDVRAEKWGEKKSIIFRGEVAYDISSLPTGLTIEQVLSTYTETGVLLYEDKGVAFIPPYSLKDNKKI